MRHSIVYLETCRDGALWCVILFIGLIAFPFFLVGLFMDWIVDDYPDDIFKNLRKP